MKYIIEISDNPVRCADGTLLWKAKGFNSLVFDIHGLSKLQRYEPHRKNDEREDAQPKAIRPKFVAEDRYIKNHFKIYPHCPKCNYELETGDCYCKVCGCHIDWSEDDVPGDGL